MKKITLLAFFLFSILEIQSQTGPCFNSSASYYGFSQASRGIASGDLNNDGIPDLATANPNSTNIGWAFMASNGSVSIGGTIPTSGGTPRAVTIADFNGDTIGDIIVAATNSIIICLGNGTGGFTVSTLNVGNPFGIASGDLNGDGNIDIVTANNGSSNISVRLGVGDGTFGTNALYTVGNGPYFVALAYMNDDDTLDVLTANIGNDMITVSIGVGDGTFNPSMQFSGGGLAQDPYSLCVGDFNNDGNNDVAVAYYQSNDVVVFNGSISGNLIMSATYSVGSQPFGITCGHYDSDNKMDFAVASYGSQNIQIYQGDGLGAFTQYSAHTTNTSSGLAVTDDFNGDGFSDIAVASYGFSGSGQGGANILLNHRSRITAIDTSFCFGDSVLLVANNGVGFNYSWSTSASINDSVMVNNSANVTLTITTTAASCSTSVSQAIVEHALPIVSGTVAPSVICNGQQTTLTGTGAQYYAWSGGITNGVPFTPAGPGTYTVIGTDANGCVNTGTASITLATAPVQELCEVTVDSASGNFNIVIWEKPADLALIDSFYIYREMTLNNYAKIGATHRDSLSEFKDYGANPHSTSFRYKLATLDTCGNISTLGLYHNSIHLQYFGAGNFQWNHYLVEGTGQVALAYNFYRDDIGTGPLNLLQVVSGSANSFTDVNHLSFPNARYRVEVDWNISCTSTRGAINTSRSNIRSPTGLIGINEESSPIQLNVYPNPFVNEVSFEMNVGFGDSKIEIYNNLGQLIVVKEFKGTKFVLNTETFAEGVYSYKLSSNLNSETGTLIKINK